MANSQSFTKSIQRRPLPTGDKVCDDELLDRLYRQRGITSPQELDRSLQAMLPPQQLQGVGKACELLVEALEQNQKIVVVGDFDVDGATSTALVISALHQLGFSQVDYLIPNRFNQGYGLSLSVAEMLLQAQAELVITVDNGISSLKSIAWLSKHGIKVLVTDHHLPSEELPCADAIVNPNVFDPSCEFPSKNLAGVGVAFYLMLALRAKLRDLDKFNAQTQPNFMQLLDLVALGTLADLVPLDHNNRILAYQGLNLIRAGKSRAGITALLEIANCNPKQLTAQDIGFIIAPRINAAGRLDSMSYGVDLLLCEDLNEAKKLAYELDSLNQARREIEAGMQAEALTLCQNLDNLSPEKGEDLGMVIFQADWHQGVIGLLASRIKDRFHRPTIVFTADENGTLRGSARSVEGVHIRDVLERIHSQYPHLIMKFGGHAMAAGLTLQEKYLTEFRNTFNSTLKEWLSDTPKQNIILSDGELSPAQLNLGTAEKLASEIWGQQFPQPLFDGEFKILRQQLLKDKHLKLLITPLNNSSEGVLIDAIAFNVDRRLFPDYSLQIVRIAYHLAVNEFREQRSLQLLVEHIEPLE